MKSSGIHLLERQEVSIGLVFQRSSRVELCLLFQSRRRREEFEDDELSGGDLKAKSQVGGHQLESKDRKERSTYQRVKLRVVEVAFSRMLTVLVRDSMELEESPLPFQSIVLGSDGRGVVVERGGEGGVRVRGKVSRREERRSGREVESETDLVDAERWER